MNDDYLWDKSGTPDPEIEQLEQLLGDLRYRRPGGKLPLPQRAPVSSPKTFRPAFAIAAAVLFAVVAAGAWFALGLRHQEATQGVAAINAQMGTSRDWLNSNNLPIEALLAADNEMDKPAPPFVEINASPDRRQRRSLKFKREAAQQSAQLASSSSPRRRERISEDEGVAAREQLIKALHLASSKLNQVQKKIQDNKTLGPVS